MSVPVLAGIDVSATPSHQEAIAIPYVAGEYIIPASWISPSYNEHDVSVPSEGGKGGGKGGSSAGQKQWKRYATCVMVWHVGVGDRLTGLILDETLVWSGNIVRVAGVHYVDIAIEGRGIYRHYWGTQTTTDALLTATGNNYGDEHPSYEGFCYGILIDFLYGIDKEQAPAARVRGERTPRQPFHNGTQTFNDDGQANLICVAAELLFDTRFGISMPVSFCSAAAWRTAIEEAYARRNTCFCSPVINDHQTAKSFLAELFSLGDIYLRPAPDTGLIECGFYPAPETINPEALVTIEESDLVEEHDLTPGSWADVKNTWTVTFRDRDYVQKENSVTDSDQRALGIHEGETRNEDVQARAIVRMWQAKMLAAERKRRFGIPGIDGVIKVYAELVESVNAGGHIRTNIDLRPGGLRKQQVFRVTRIKRTVKGVAELTLDAERTLSPITYDVPIVPRLPDPEPEEIPEVGASRFFELPWQSYAIGILAARDDGLLTGFALHYDRNIVGTYQTLPSTGGGGFALKARLAEALPVDPTQIKLELLGTLARELIASDPGDVAARDDQLLLVLVKTVDGQIAADGDGNAFLEIASCEQFVVTGPNLVTVTALRGRQNSQARAFEVNTEAWLVRRVDLPVAEHSDFKVLAAGGTAYFKLQASKLRDRRPLEDCAVRPFNFPPHRVPPPDGTDDGLTPDPVSNVTVTDGLELIVLRWEMPSTTPLKEVQIFESATTVAPSAPTFVVSALQSFFFRSGLATTDTRYYWLRVRAVNGRLSALVGPYEGHAGANVPAGVQDALDALDAALDQEIANSENAHLGFENAIAQQEADFVALVEQKKAEALLAAAGDATAKANAVAQTAAGATSAVSQRTDSLEATVNNAATGLAATRSRVQNVEDNFASKDYANARKQEAIEAAAGDATAKANAVAQTAAGANSALGQRTDSLEATVNNAATGLAATRSRVQNVEENFASKDYANARKAEAIEAAAGDATAKANAVAQTAAGATSAVSQRTDALEATVNNAATGLAPTRAKVTTLADAFVDAGGNAVSRWGAKLEAASDGQLVQTGFEMVAKNGANPVSAIRMLADIIEFRSSLTSAGVAPFIKVGENIYINSAMINAATITRAMIADLAVGSAQIGNAEVGTLKIAGNAVSVPMSASWSGIYTGDSYSHIILQVDYYAPAAMWALVALALHQGYYSTRNTSWSLWLDGTGPLWLDGTEIEWGDSQVQQEHPTSVRGINLAAGWHKFTFRWSGFNSDVLLISADLAILGAMR